MEARLHSLAYLTSQGPVVGAGGGTIDGAGECHGGGADGGAEEETADESEAVAARFALSLFAAEGGREDVVGFFECGVELGIFGHDWFLQSGHAGVSDVEGQMSLIMRSAPAGPSERASRALPLTRWVLEISVRRASMTRSRRARMVG